jgi:hypothetical protein
MYNFVVYVNNELHQSSTHMDIMDCWNGYLDLEQDIWIPDRSLSHPYVHPFVVGNRTVVDIFGNTGNGDLGCRKLCARSENADPQVCSVPERSV